MLSALRPRTLCSQFLFVIWRQAVTETCSPIHHIVDYCVLVQRYSTTKLAMRPLCVSCLRTKTRAWFLISF
ncbi:hypothetical protein CPB85DRAFT_1339327 [Mucidula mucida]|nr:hypothetical protein CPB85DRAFT_1339327 [Mucidula mucida]